MTGKQYILFDLDGTIADTGEGVTNSVAYALRKLDLEEQSRESLNKFVGPPLKDSFMDFCGLSDGQAEEAVRVYREYYARQGVTECHLYPGMAALLEALTDAGKKVFVATSKPEVFALRVLRHFGIDRFFTFVSGSELNGERVHKAEVIQRALTQGGITDPGQAVMIGDRKFDILGARAHGIDSIGALYGYGSRQELEEHSPTALADSVARLAQLLGV